MLASTAGLLLLNTALGVRLSPIGAAVEVGLVTSLIWLVFERWLDLDLPFRPSIFQ